MKKNKVIFCKKCGKMLSASEILKGKTKCENCRGKHTLFWKKVVAVFAFILAPLGIILKRNN